MRVKVFPHNKIVEEWIGKFPSLVLSRKFEKVEVLHFLSSSRLILLILLKIYKPDLLVSHKKFFQGLRIPELYFPFKKGEDWVLERNAKSNNLKLSKFYLRKLGLQKNIQIIKSKHSYFKFSDILSKIQEFQCWK